MGTVLFVKEIIRGFFALIKGEKPLPVGWPTRKNDVSGSFIAANENLLALETKFYGQANRLAAAGREELGCLGSHDTIPLNNNTVNTIPLPLVSIKVAITLSARGRA
jgi:hypothetical protein